MSLLNWRRPDPEQLELDESTIWIARGLGGHYRIQPDLEKFIVWLDDDAFAFETFGTVEECKQFAEDRFRNELGRLAGPRLMEAENKLRRAESMAAAIDFMIHTKVLNPRSVAADARLSFGDPYGMDEARAIVEKSRPPMERKGGASDA